MKGVTVIYTLAFLAFNDCLPHKKSRFWETDNKYCKYERSLDNLSHELLGGEDQLVVDEPAGLLLEQRAVGVDVDRLLVLHRLVAAFAQSRRVIEISCCHRLGEGRESYWQRCSQTEVKSSPDALVNHSGVKMIPVFITIVGID